MSAALHFILQKLKLPVSLFSENPVYFILKLRLHEGEPNSFTFRILELYFFHYSKFTMQPLLECCAHMKGKLPDVLFLSSGVPTYLFIYFVYSYLSFSFPRTTRETWPLNEQTAPRRRGR